MMTRLLGPIDGPQPLGPHLDIRITVVADHLQALQAPTLKGQAQRATDEA